MHASVEGINMYRMIDVPQVPTELILPLDKVLELENFFGGYTKNYTIHEVQDDLRAYLKPLFPHCKKFRYQTLVDNVPVHIDRGRTTAINYIVDPGGDNVSTAWYTDEFGDKIEEVVLPTNQWHEIEVDKWHTVHGITRRRYAITVCE
jgi:hypothetical protein